MRRTFVITLALLTVALTGGTCEFRASSHNPIQAKPPEGESNERDPGLLLLIDTGGFDASGGGAAIESAIIKTALAASVLSVPSRTPTPSADSPMPRLRTGQALEPPVIRTNSSRIANPIPEPSGFWLYGIGSVFLAWRLRGAR